MNDPATPPVSAMDDPAAAAASDDEGIEVTHESIVQNFLSANHSALYARGLQLPTDVLAEHDIPPHTRQLLFQQPQLQRRDLAYLLLLSLEPPHFHHVLRAIQPLQAFDLVGLLPLELARLILMHLDPPTLVVCEQVSRAWQTRARDTLVWKKAYQDAGFQLDLEAVNWWCGYGTNHDAHHLHPTPSRQQQMFFDEGLATEPDVGAQQPAAAHHPRRRTPGWLPPPKTLHLPSVSSIHQAADDGRPQVDYKHLYRLQVLAAQNIRDGVYAVHHITNPSAAHPADEPPMYPDPAPGEAAPHDTVYCFQAAGNRLIAGGRNRDGSPPDVLEYDLATGEIVQFFTGQQTSVLTLQFEAGLTNALISGARDGALVIWDLDTAAPRAEIQAHQKSLLNLHFDSQAALLVTGSKDKTAKVWSMTSWEVLHTLRGHDSAINSVQIHDGRIVTGSGDKTIRLWSAATGECLRTFVGHLRGIASISFDGSRILSGGSDCTIRMHEVHSSDSSAEPLLTPGQFGHLQQRTRSVTRYGYRTAINEPHPSSTNSDLVRTVQMDRRFVAVGSYDRSIKICNPDNGDLLLSILGAHTNAIFHLQLDAHRIITSSQDGHIKIFNFLPGEKDTSFIA